MFQNLMLRRVSFLASTLVGIGGLAFAAPETSKTAAQVADLFQDARTTAGQLKRDVMEMESYARSRVTWQAHSAQIMRIREHVNKAGQLAAQLDKLRDGAEQWHQTAIDRLTPVLRELASNIESMIVHINKQTNMLDPTYDKYLKSNELLASELSELISNTVEYDKTKAEMQKLEVAAK